VFFETPVDARAIEAFLARNKLTAAVLCTSEPRKPKLRAQWSYDLAVPPTRLDLTPPEDWERDPWSRDGTLSMFVSASFHFTAYEEWLLENDTLPESIAQVVTVGSYMNGALAYDAVNALTRRIEESLGGRHRMSARK
jgi:hypothetical protein